MKTYREFRPTGFDLPGLGIRDERADWLVAPCGTNRDADAVTLANWAVQSFELESVDPDGADHEIHRFGHWACGWFELVLLRPDSRAAALCAGFEASLADYPILDEEKLSETELELAELAWKNTSLRERVRLCRDAGVSIFAARHDSPPVECIEGLTR